MLPFLLALLSTEAAAQGFYDTCSTFSLGWNDGAVYPWLMVASCTDDRGRERASFISLSDCYANREGEIVPEPSGGVGQTCANCEVEGSLLMCQCARTWNGVVDASVDLDEVMKNEDGILACHDFLGIEIDSLESSPA